MSGAPVAANDLDAVSDFLAALSAISAKYGIGLEGGQLYLLDGEDRQYRYDADTESRLVRV